MNHATLGLGIAKRLSELGVLDQRSMELAMAKAEEIVTKSIVAARNVETVAHWVRQHYPQWFGAAPGTVAVTPAPAPQPAPSAPASNPAPSAKGKQKKGEAAQSATGPAEPPVPPQEPAETEGA
jgi:hypothetical protein